MEAPEVAYLTGAGPSRCAVCRGQLDYSWHVTYSDGSQSYRCLEHIREKVEDERLGTTTH